MTTLAVFSSSLSTVSTWITYVLQIACGYVLTRAVCALIQNPRLRLRVWRYFLFFAVAGWIFLCVPAPASISAQLGTHSFSLQATSPLSWSWPLQPSWAPRLSWLGAWARRFYLSVFIILVAQSFLKWFQLRSFLANTRCPSHELNLEFQKICQELKVSRCKLGLLPGLRSPATTGSWPPYVLLPMELTPQLDTDQLAEIFRHELIHVKRRDYIWDQLAALGCRVVFFHPAVWRTQQHIWRERELACDQEVVKDQWERRLHYADCLTKLASWWFLAGTKSPGGIGFSPSSSLLATRVRALLQERIPHSRFHLVGRVALVAALAFLGVSLLPGMQLRAFWSARPDALPTQSHDADFPSSRASAGTRSPGRIRKALKAEGVHYYRSLRPEHRNGETFSSIFPRTGSPALPLIKSPSKSAGEGEADTRATSDNSSTDAPTSRPAWDEAPPGSQRTAPNWQDLAVGAAGTGVAIIRGQTGSQDGQSGGQQPGETSESTQY